MKTTITGIRSGGQSGVDRAALDFARKNNMEICGWCPKGGWAEDYPEEPGILAVYPELQETPEAEPWQRTLWNMRDAQAILTIMPEGSEESKGTQLGVQEGIELGKPMFTAHGVEDAAEIVEWLRSLEVDGCAILLVVASRLTQWTGQPILTSVVPDQPRIGIELCVGGRGPARCPNGYRVTMEILEKVKELLDLTKFGIRVMTIDDYEKVYALWMSCKNMGFNNLGDSPGKECKIYKT